MEDIFQENEEDIDEDVFPNIDPNIEEINFQPLSVIEPEIGAGDCRPVVTETTLQRNETEEEAVPSTTTAILRSRCFYYAVFLSALFFFVRIDEYFSVEYGQTSEVPFLELMIRCNERRYELIHNLNIIHTALKRCTLEDSKKDEAEKMLSLLHSLYERHIVDLEEFTERIPKSCKTVGKMNSPS
ncbi:uncharacterized protein [Halyomorpha halys]|uniref:uncharacterized protein n=1 Tax=Halyomorpha halys TaxID=286706 RepID=UPI0006D4F4C4|nr:uncharacterized protein LOC106678131 [Halyomorpha halys]